MSRALVVEGGAMRGIFAAGVLDSFIQQQWYEFDFAMGVSAGATNLTGYLSKQFDRNRQVITELATQREFYNPFRFILGGHMTDVRWLWQQAWESHPLDTDTMWQTMPLYAGLTNVLTGRCEYPQVSEENIHQVMEASCSLPIAYRNRPVINGTPYIDGGMADSIPVMQAYKMGARDITVILSQAKGYERPDPKSTWAIQKMFGDHPRLMRTMLTRARKYNRTLKFIYQAPADCTIRVIAPPSEFAVSRLTMDQSKLHHGYELGVEAGFQFLQETPVHRAA